MASSSQVKAQKKLALPTCSCWTFSLQNGAERTLCWLSHADCGTLLQRPWKRTQNTAGVLTNPAKLAKAMGNLEVFITDSPTNRKDPNLICKYSTPSGWWLRFPETLWALASSWDQQPEGSRIPHLQGRRRSTFPGRAIYTCQWIPPMVYMASHMFSCLTM